MMHSASYRRLVGSVPYKLRLLVVLVVTVLVTICVVHIIHTHHEQQWAKRSLWGTPYGAQKDAKKSTPLEAPPHIPQHGPNLLSTKVVPSGSLSTGGWWMSHVKWDVEAPSQSNQLTQVLGAQCSIHRIVEIFQYLAINEYAPVDGFLFTATSASWDLTLPDEDDHVLGESYRPFYSARSYVVLDDGGRKLIKLDFPVRKNKKKTTKALRFVVPPGRRVKGIMFVLACFGYDGYVAFTHLAVIPWTGKISHARSDYAGAVDRLRSDYSGAVDRLRSDYILPCPTPDNSSLSGDPRILFSKVVTSAYSNQDKAMVTMVAQLTFHRLKKLKKALQLWDGPVSVCIYVQVKEDEDIEDVREDVEQEVTADMFSGRTTAHVVLLYGNQGADRYPINYLRNVGIRNSKTSYILVLDADFVPSQGLQHLASDHIQRYVTAIHSSSLKVGFVVPAFETRCKRRDPLPRNKHELLARIRRKVIRPFRVLESPLSHKPTNYNTWQMSREPYETTAYQDKYEPYLILRRTPELPLYDERFTGYGMNKISHVMELALLRYMFVVLPDVWVIHCNHRTSKLSLAHRMDPDVRFANRLQRFQFLNELNSRHGLEGCRKQS